MTEELWITIALPAKGWRALIECLGPDGVGWGEYSHPEEREFERVLAEIKAAYAEQISQN